MSVERTGGCFHVKHNMLQLQNDTVVKDFSAAEFEVKNSSQVGGVI